MYIKILNYMKDIILNKVKYNRKLIKVTTLLILVQIRLSFALVGEFP